MSKITNTVKRILDSIQSRTPRKSTDSDGTARRKARSLVPLCFIYLMAFLFGRTLLANTIAPLGPSFYAGYRTALGDFSFLAAIFVLAGSATLRQWNQLVPLALSITAITLLVRPGKKSKYARVSDPLIAGFCVFMARVGTSLLNGPNLSSYLVAFTEGLCTMVAGLVFVSAFSSGATRNQQALSTTKGNQAFIVLALFAIGGLRGITVMNLNVATILFMAGTLVVAYSEGPAAGALTGFMGGLVSCLAGGQDPSIIGCLGISGVLAGLGGWFGRTGAALGYLSAGLALSFYGDSASSISQRLLEQIVSVAAIAFINNDVKEVLQKYIPDVNLYPKESSQASNAGNVSLIPPKLAALSGIFQELGRLFKEAGASKGVTADQTTGDFGSRVKSGEAPSIRWPKGSDRLFSGASDRAGPLAGGKSTERYTRAPQGGMPHGDGDVSIVKQLVEKVCDDCGNRPFCWEEHFGQTYEGFVDLARKARLTGKLGLAPNDSVIADRCHRFRELIVQINHEKQIQRLEKRLASIDSETSDCLAFQYKCLGQLLSSDRLLAGTGTGSTRARPLRLSVKGTTIPASGVDKPGDMWLRYDLDGGKTLVVLADGMGKGDAAARQSKDAIVLLKALIDCGLDHASCISFLNSALYLAWRPDSFVALDCLVIDAGVERGYFYKLGAPPSFIRKGDGNVLVVRGSKPPAGAVTDLFCYGTSEPISPGDLIFLVSDGLFRSSPVPARAEQMIMTRLGRLKDSDLDNCVKSLVNHSLRYQRQTPDDDITVVGALIESV